MMNYTPIDLERARRETPGCEHVLHFNNAGASLMPQPVIDTVLDHLQLEARTGGYEAASAAQAAIEQFYRSVAALLGGQPEEIAFIENATRAWDMAFYAIPFRPGDRILTAQAEYASNYIAFLQVAQRAGAVVEAIPNNEHGQLSIPALANMLDDRVKLIAITHVPTNGGLVNPAAEVGRLARQAGVLYLLDACQSVGQMPINVAEIGCDMLSATGRKFLRGPRGTGFLYVRRELAEQLEPPLLDLHAARWTARDRYEIRPDARRFENWERNYAAKLGLGAAVRYALKWGLEAIWARVEPLANQLRERLEQLPGVKVRDLGATRCGIVTFTVEGRRPEALRQALRDRQINVTTSTVFSTRLDMESRRLTELVRASLHYYNSEAEIDRFCTTLAELLQDG
jgi:selenocysteine lyase/cysteine desulfurase